MLIVTDLGSALRFQERFPLASCVRVENDQVHVVWSTLTGHVQQEKCSRHQRRWKTPVRPGGRKETTYISTNSVKYCEFFCFHCNCWIKPGGDDLWFASRRQENEELTVQNAVCCQAAQSADLVSLWAPRLNAWGHFVCVSVLFVTFWSAHLCEKIPWHEN